MDHQTTPYNLIHQPWIPVIREEGGPDWITPWQITEGIGGHKGDPVLRFASPRPDFNGALHEFLIGLLTTCFTPKDEGEWRTYWNTPPAPEELKQAFMKFEHAFNLDGDGPRFMQDFDELGGDAVPIGNLLMDEPGDNTLVRNADHFIKRGGISSLGYSAAAMALFALQVSGPGDGGGHRACMRKLGPLTTLVVSGKNLWGRIWPNAQNTKFYRKISPRPITEKAEDIFPWLSSTRTSEKKQLCTPDDTHPFHFFWGMPRRIRLHFSYDEVVPCSISQMLNDKCVKHFHRRKSGMYYSEGWAHPHSPYAWSKSKKSMRPLSARSGHISYRDWLGIIVSDENILRPAQTINQAVFRERQISNCRLYVFGYEIDKKKQGVVRGWMESEMPLQFFDSEKMRDEIVALTPRLVRSAEQVAGQLTGVVKRALFENPKESKGDFSHISDRFWRETETDFFHLLEKAKEEFKKGDGDIKPALARQWLDKVLRPTATRLFDEYASSSDIEFKNMKRLIDARSSLILMLNGWGKSGGELYKRLNIPIPAKKAKEAKQMAETQK